MLSKKVDQVLKPVYKQRPVVIFLRALNILISIVPPLLTSRLINIFGYYGGEGAARYIALIALSIIAYFFINWLQDYHWYKMEYIGMGMVRAFIFSNVVHKNYLFLQGTSLGDVENKVIHDAGIYAQARLSHTSSLILNILHITVVAVVLFYMNFVMTLAAMAFFFVFFFAYKLVNKGLRRTSLKEREGYGDMLVSAHEILAGVNTIQLYGKEEFFAHRFEKNVDKYEHFLINLQKWKGLTHAATGSLVWFMPLVAVAIGFWFYHSPMANMDVGDIAAFYFFLPNLTAPIKSLTEFNISVQNSKVVESRLSDLLIDEPTLTENLTEINKINKLEFSNICYKYDNKHEVLHNLNFSVSSGDALAVVGPSGTGKTTFLRMLKRQLEPSWGKILINGVSHHDVDEKSYINRIAVLTQEVFVFDDTVQENINFGQDLPVEKVAKMADMAALGYLNLQELAINLSTGEKQRMGLARALACEYDILILDEPTAELDFDTETQIIENLKLIQKETNCILIIITHSDNILQNLCNQKLVLSKPL